MLYSSTISVLFLYKQIERIFILKKLNIPSKEKETLYMLQTRIPRATKRLLEKIARKEGHAQADIVRHFLDKGIKEYYEYDQTKEVEGA